MTGAAVAARLRTTIPTGWRALASPAVEYAAAPLAARRPVRRFVIVCGPRTGSELLRELLDSRPDVQCEGELLQQAKRWPLAYLNGRAVLGGTGHRAWGCKILDSHLHEGLVESSPPGDQLLAALVDDGWAIIHLRRHDLLAQALSFLLAMEGQWHFRKDSGFTPFEADPAAVIALLYVLDGNARWLEEQVAQVPHTTIGYEEDLRPPDARAAALGRLADLLGLPHAAGGTDLRAGAPPRPEDRLTNLPEVVRALQQTRFASLVDGSTGEG
jgi:LPS sulfotransferase NodH